MKFGGFDIGNDDSLLSTYEQGGLTIIKIGWPAAIWFAALACVIIVGLLL